MTKEKKSPAAKLMYGIIAVTCVTAIVCFTLYYGGFYTAGAVLWTGVTAFTIVYHLWMRILLGNVSKLFPVHYTQRWFREKAFEKKLYRFLRVKKWKDRVLTYNPELFAIRTRTPEDIVLAMTKAELDHWINQLISLGSLFFALLWGQFWIFLLTALCAMAFDGQFIVIQRYNRPRVLRLMEREKKIREAVTAL